MKTLKNSIALILFLTASITFAQDINYNNEVYTVKGKTVYKDGKDQTEILSVKEQAEIKSRFENVKKQENELKKAEKSKKKALKKQKQAEKALKKQQKQIKKREKAASNLKKAENRLAKEQKKYEKLQKKNKIKPEDHSKWDNKFNKLKAQVEKAKKRLNRA